MGVENQASRTAHFHDKRQKQNCCGHILWSLTSNECSAMRVPCAKKEIMRRFHVEHDKCCETQLLELVSLNSVGHPVL